MDLNTIHNKDCLQGLKTLPDNSVDCCVTSPPYYGLRDYGTATWVGGNPDCKHLVKCNGYAAYIKQKTNIGTLRTAKDVCPTCGAVRIDSQIGLEKTPEAYISKLAEVFTEVFRILKPTGTLWLNIGDSYWGGKGYSGSSAGVYQYERRKEGKSITPECSNIGGKGEIRPTDRKHEYIKAKDLIGIPWMLAFELRRAGFYLRQDIIWHKPNPMPESGKDSQVCYDLCLRSGIKFKAYYNVSFESNETKRFIRECYPDVIFRKEHKFGFIENISKNHSSLLPTVEMAYCCTDYKHNPKYSDAASIVGVRKQESFKRRSRTVFEAKNKTVLKKNKSAIDEHFTVGCQSTGGQSEIQLKPILEWSDSEVWSYIYRHNLPVNPEYKSGVKRIGCMVCPKANFSSNVITLKRYPKLIDALIRVRERRNNINWNITRESKPFDNDKVYYIAAWLNHSFRPFTKRQWQEYEDFITNYYRKGNANKLKY